MKRIVLLAMTVLFFFPLCVTTTHGLPGASPDIQAAWDHDTVNTVGYYLYWRSETEIFDNARRKACGSIEDLKCAIADVPLGSIIAVTAYNNVGESEFSNEVPFAVPAAPAGLRTE